ncbi:hypothetical protein [Sphingomonas sp. BAUL-RG-20F-R05-02]|uniref:hypothetical protein n=1 Tax=Sphingomonas sp. BAUL-RG-20F-R05-02 TaxID=2914830 RepID=UPI001F5A8072|nr:hypothetical protein [Sphingomonas sp. BAUL-RG-20F-R05-02]
MTVQTHEAARKGNETSQKAGVRDTLETTLENAKDSASKALASAGDTAKETARKTAEGIEANPLSVLVGGVALGVLAGALIPRSDREAQLLKPVGQRLTDAARGATDAAKEAGLAELDGLGLSPNAAKDTAGKLIEGLLKALSTAGSAAAKGAMGKN